VTVPTWIPPFEQTVIDTRELEDVEGYIRVAIMHQQDSVPLVVAQRLLLTVQFLLAQTDAKLPK